MRPRWSLDPIRRGRTFLSFLNTQEGTAKSNAFSGQHRQAPYIFSLLVPRALGGTVQLV